MTASLSILHPGVESPGKPQGNKTLEKTGRPSGLAPRINLQGAAGKLRLALLDNTKVNAEELLVAVGKRLKDFGFGETRIYRKRHAGESGAVQIEELMKWKPDLVLTGLGD